MLSNPCRSCYFKCGLCPRGLLLSAPPAVTDRLQLLEQARLSKGACAPVMWPFRPLSGEESRPSGHQPGRPLGGQLYQGVWRRGWRGWRWGRESTFEFLMKLFYSVCFTITPTPPRLSHSHKSVNLNLLHVRYIIFTFTEGKLFFFLRRKASGSFLFSKLKSLTVWAGSQGESFHRTRKKTHLLFP